MMSGSGVSSRRLTPAGKYGRNAARYGFSGFAPTMSGYSLVEATSVVSVAIGLDLQQGSWKCWGVAWISALLYRASTQSSKIKATLTASVVVLNCARQTATFLSIRLGY